MLRVPGLLAFAVLAIACNNGGERLTYIAAPAALAKPVQITGTGRYELWAVVDLAAVGGDSATVAHSRDGGATWDAAVLPGFGPQPVQLATERDKVWVAGTHDNGNVGLASVTADERGLTVADVSFTFPLGSSDMVLRSGGNDPDPMLTVRVPDASQQRVVYVLDSSPRGIWYRPSGALPDFSLVAVWDSLHAHFVSRTAAGATLTFCAIVIGSSWETICLDLPPWGDRFERIYGSSSGGNGDWLWRPTPTGGDAMIRRGGDFAFGPVTRWPEGLEPLRFLALNDGTVGVLAERTGTLVWVELDGYLAAIRERFLVACDGPCDINAADVALLHDGALLVPTSRGWYVGEPDWHFE